MVIRDPRNISNSLHEVGAVTQKHDPHYHRTSLKAYTLLTSSVRTRYKTVVTKSPRNEKSLGLSRNPPPSVQPPAAKTHHEPNVQFTTSRPINNLSFRLSPALSCGPSLQLSYLILWCMFLRVSLYKRREGNQLDAAECFIALIICSTCFGHLYTHHQELETILPSSRTHSLLLCS